LHGERNRLRLLEIHASTNCTFDATGHGLISAEYGFLRIPVIVTGISGIVTADSVLS
jgi:hypothetical protein